MGDNHRCGLTLEEGTSVTAPDAVGHVYAGKGNATGVNIGGKGNFNNLVSSAASKTALGQNIVGTQVGENGIVTVQNLTSRVNVR
ncbi:unnamed protein product [Allacma fusca]|uniref:Uncharacterized protein n=1 Tax=Allacma fusca TaxID=39272 RepID=A0A8J2P3H5_9HEXA|nr:unnamed protein product [Allacma fusca]